MAISTDIPGPEVLPKDVALPTEYVEGPDETGHALFIIGGQLVRINVGPVIALRRQGITDNLEIARRLQEDAEREWAVRFEQASTPPLDQDAQRHTTS